MTALLPTGAAGVYLKSASFLTLTDALRRGFEGLLWADAVKMAGPAVMAWEHLDRCEYPTKFPQLVAGVAPLLDDAGQTRLALLPAACLPVYPMVAQQGPIGPDGLLITTHAQCFRQEVAYSEVRQRAFNMSEWVFFGSEDQVARFRARAVDVLKGWLGALGLEGAVRTANDPFYGRGREIMIEAQLQQDLKLELTVPVGVHGDVACFSLNHHRDFFARRFEIALADGQPCHSVCVGMGLERLGLAILDQHGADAALWPKPVLEAVGLEG